MLIRFSAQNFRSIGSKKVTLNMIASPKIKQQPDHICPSDLPIKIVRNAVIYGANASGKTNLMKAFLFFLLSVQIGILPADAVKEFCRTQEQNAKKNTAFDVQFENGGLCFDYGFECRLDQPAIMSEWLYRLDDAGSELIFNRDENGITLGMNVSQSDRARFDIYREDFLNINGSQSAPLFLSYLNSGRSFGQDSALNIISTAFSWFASKVQMLGPGSPNPNIQFYMRKSLDEVSDLLASFDTGISKVEKKEVHAEDIARFIPQELLPELNRHLAELPLPETQDDVVGMTIRTNDVLIGVEKKHDGSLLPTVMKIKHTGSVFDFDFGDESDGTRRLFDFIDMILTQDEDSLFVIDELSRSLHPLLTQHFIKLFNEVHKNDRCQLVFTTHENDIMSYDLFRRDEIWFVERDEVGETTLYPLDRFVARSDARVGKQYLEGRYGGIPVLSLENSLLALQEG